MLAKPTFKERLQKAFPVFPKMLARSKPLIRQAIVAGGAAGALTLASIKLGDELVSVINLTDASDMTSEFSIKVDGKIDNTGGTSTAAKKLLVTWHPWAE